MRPAWPARAAPKGAGMPYSPLAGRAGVAIVRTGGAGSINTTNTTNTINKGRIVRTAGDRTPCSPLGALPSAAGGGGCCCRLPAAGPFFAQTGSTAVAVPPASTVRKFTALLSAPTVSAACANREYTL
jgi:hypothetical protein